MKSSGDKDNAGEPLEGTGLTLAQYKKLVDISWEGADYRQMETPEELHQFVWTYNWDEGVEPLRWIINHPNCDRGTALMVYWAGGPGWYCQYESRDEVNEYELEVYDLLQEVEQKYVSGAYTRQDIHFDPTNDEGTGTDWTQEYKKYQTKRQIPAEMYKHTHGTKLKRVTL